jgi:hypothetical protein
MGDGTPIKAESRIQNPGARRKTCFGVTGYRSIGGKEQFLYKRCFFTTEDTEKIWSKGKARFLSR